MREEVSCVFVVDADESVREPLARLLSAARCQLLFCSSAQEFLASPRPAGPSCVISELLLPDMSGLELQASLAERPEMPVIFMSNRRDVASAVRAMRAGALDFILKPVSDHFLNSVSLALAHSCGALSEGVKLTSLRSRYQGLSRREREVMTLVTQGNLNKQIARELGISEVTVKAHRGRMMRKMSAASLADLVRMEAQLGLGLSPLNHGYRPNCAHSTDYA